MANQVKSTYKLLDMGLDIKGILPAHGSPFYPKSSEHLAEEVKKAATAEQ